MSYWKFTKMLVTLYTYHDRSFKTLMLNKLIMNINFKSKLSELEDETLISSIISEWAVPLRETEVADSHRKSSVWPLQFGLSLSPLLLTEKNPQSPHSNGFPQSGQVLRCPLLLHKMWSWKTREDSLPWAQSWPARASTRHHMGISWLC